MSNFHWKEGIEGGEEREGRSRLALLRSRPGGDRYAESSERKRDADSKRTVQQCPGATTRHDERQRGITGKNDRQRGRVGSYGAE